MPTLESIMERASGKAGRLTDFGGREFIQFGRAALEDIFSSDMGIRGKIALLHHPDAASFEIPDPVFIVGFPRTGSTRLHKLLALDPAAEKLTHWELQHGFATETVPGDDYGTERDPRVQLSDDMLKLLDLLTPKLHTAHDIKSLEVDECYQGFLDLTMPTISHLNGDVFPRTIALHKDRSMVFLYDNYRKLVQVLLHQKVLARKAADPTYVYNKKYTVFKCPLHTIYLKDLVAVFPNARLLFTHRDMRRVLPSFCSLIEIARATFSDEVMSIDLIRQNAMSPTAEMLRNIKERDSLGVKNVDLQYTDQMKNTIGSIQKCYAELGLTVSEEFVFELEKAMEREKLTRGGNQKTLHTYSLEQYGISEERIVEVYGEYECKFGIIAEQRRIV
ncbi:P-loop containing nucleoside triphosphate hydrolase protein [Cladochytrium replicatum]|nr:P-loop containing nucleoside triphosphate hydrolase protein [Cladochytrium replicatum]